MKHLKYFVICLLGTLLLPGCYKDLGNYDYDEINREAICFQECR